VIPIPVVLLHHLPLPLLLLVLLFIFFDLLDVALLLLDLCLLVEMGGWDIWLLLFDWSFLLLSLFFLPFAFLLFKLLLAFFSDLGSLL
jgi:hypothetical protein